jgi:SAM-dependent methyltransferase
VVQSKKIDPRELIQKFSVEDLCATAEAYFAGIANSSALFAKPFYALDEAPALLRNLGMLLAGMNLGPTMTVLDFAAGSCWLSRFLAQMQCATISCDVSPSALELGRRLFRDHPPVVVPISEPQFLHFDGHKLDLADESVDRVICFDGFHHVANQREVLAELCRVLRPGGIAGFCEPGPQHSQSPEAQTEMANYNVLENDIVLADIGRVARDVGFTACRAKVMTDLEIGFDEHAKLVGAVMDDALRAGILENAQTLARQGGVFFLHKGSLVFDSRRTDGLAHELQLESAQLGVQVGMPVSVRVQARNRGRASWLATSSGGIGEVHLGAHLYDAAGVLLELDFARGYLPADVAAGASVPLEIELRFDKRGEYRVALDLVSEHIAWFGNLGSQPVTIAVSVV